VREDVGASGGWKEEGRCKEEGYVKRGDEYNVSLSHVNTHFKAAKVVCESELR